jgi:PPP family 3-phenylpropionic acid transporter
MNARQRSLVVRTRLLQFVFWAGAAFLVPYLTLYYDQAGLTGLQIGLQTALYAGLSLVLGPVWGAISDRVGRPRLMLQVALVGTGVSALILGRQVGLLPITLATAAYGCFASGGWTLIEVVTVQQARAAGVGYGSVRLWGSLGWTAVVWLAGEAIQRTSLWTGFAGYFVGAILTALAAAWIPEPEQTAESGSRSAFARTLPGSPALLWLAAGLLVLLIAEIGPIRFLTLYTVDLGGREGLVGLALAVGALLEWPMMLAADRLVARYQALRVLELSALVWTVCWLAGAIIPFAPLIILVMILNSAGYTLFAVGMIGAVTRYVRPEHSGEALGLYSVTLRSMAELIGGPLGGWGYDLATGRGLFAMSAGISLLAWALLRRVAGFDRAARGNKAAPLPAGGAPGRD